MRRLLGVLAALTVLLAACADGPDEEPAADAEFREGVAATVNGTEIPRADVDQRVEDAAAADEDLAAFLEGEEGAQLMPVMRAQALTILVQSQIIEDGAAELSVEATDEERTEAREELAAQFGGEDELREAARQAGLSDEALEQQFEGLATLNAVRNHLVAEGAEVDEPVEGVDPGDMALQQWLMDQLAAADVDVHPDYGTWNAATGEVMPDAGELPDLEIQD